MIKSQEVPSVPPGTAEELNQLAKRYIQERRYDEAKQCLDASLAQQETAAAYRYFGVICRFQKDLQGALEWLEKSLKVDPNDHATLCQVAETYFDAGDFTQATAYYAFAITNNPQDLFYKTRFISIGANVQFANYAEVVEQALVECLKTPELDCSPAQALWYNTFLLNPAFLPIYKTTKDLMGRDTGSFDKKHFDNAPDLSPLVRPFFLLGLKNIVVFSLAFEEFIGHLRETLLNEAGNATTIPGYKSIASAVALYCFNNEYAIDVTADEEKALSTLRQRIEAGAKGNEAAIAIYGCYYPLQTLSNARQVMDVVAADAETADLKGPLAEYFALQEIRGTITAVTPIDDAVSKKVREMYEESPYPRWKAIPKNLQLDAYGRLLQKPGAQILIAGCGTGHEAIQYAVLFPEAKVQAIDLSLTSLSYAIHKAKEYKLQNISFNQADILNLGALNRQFDCVVAGGVLHHLQDPFKGWQVLTGLLKPDGLMKIALYSKIARRDLMSAHKIIREQGHANLDLKGMRAFRKNSAKHLGKDLLRSVSSYDDYYYLSMYRDMMFHVQEHDPDLHEIEDMLSRLGLKFLQFVLPRDVMARYAAAFPADPQGEQLKNWQKFEKDNPSTFSACYIFWCRKK